MGKVTFAFEVSTDGEAFDGDPTEAGRILLKAVNDAARYLTDHPVHDGASSRDFPLFDLNGNRVGTATLTC